jgi:soluble lytic murein transglycosylase-like protein
MQREYYQDAVEKASSNFGVDPFLIEAVIQQESSGNADAFRHEPGFYLRYLKNNPEFKGQNPRRISSSYGLMQLMYTTARELGFTGAPEDLFDINLNVNLGTKLLKKLLDKYKGDVEKALMAYNGGHGGVGKAQPLAYARAVLMRYESIKTARDPRHHLQRNA